VFRNRGSHRFGPLIRYSAPLLASNLLSYLMGSADRYLILLLAGQDVLGIYSPAVTASSVLGVVSGAVGGALFPLLSRKLGGIDREAFREISRVSSRYVFLFYVPLAFGMAATAYPTMAFFVGERFLEGAIPLAILALASAFACGSVVVNSVLLAMGRTTIFSFASLLSIGSDLVLSFLLIGSLGPIGAALARASTLIVSFGLPALFLVRLKGQNLDLPAFKKSLAASSGMALVVLAMQLIWMSKYLLPLYVVGGGLAYFAMLRALKTFNEEDFALISRLVPGKVRVLVSLLQKYLTL
ncbi:polysaccharide biosynthesis C-terminal domain-containing protein, partial [Candidatus Bathyarchaeota archaeon]|nr:polysaccharide biosynthesis C-terminal domain-containing protein [Candidatus Bathyarchaeota archaeon]